MGWPARQIGGSQAAPLFDHRGGRRADACPQQAPSTGARAASRDIRREAQRGPDLQLEIRSLPARAGAAPAITGGSRFVVVAHHMPNAAAACGGELPAKFANSRIAEILPKCPQRNDIRRGTLASTRQTARSACRDPAIFRAAGDKLLISRRRSGGIWIPFAVHLQSITVHLQFISEGAGYLPRNVNKEVVMKFVGTALLGAAGLLALSLSAQAAGSMGVTDKAFSSTTATPYMQLARDENPGGDMYKKKMKKAKKTSENTTTPLMQMARDENPGGGMYKKSKKKKKKHA